MDEVTISLGKKLREILNEKSRDFDDLIRASRRGQGKIALVDMGEDKVNRMFDVLEQHGIQPTLANLNKKQTSWVFKHHEFEFLWIDCNYGSAKLQIAFE